MRKNLTILFLFLFTLTYGQDEQHDDNYYKQKLDEKYGFREHKFGTDISNIKGLVYVRKNADGSEKVYSRTSEVMNLGSVEFSLIQYKFFHNKLWCIYVQLKPGKTHSDQFLDMLIKNYGIKGAYQGRWVGDRMVINLKPNTSGDEYFFYSLPMGVKMSEEIKKKNNAASDKL